jgi:uncharacterized protein YgiM (DUF1202 family)
MRSVRIAAAAGIVATGLALGAAGIASAATPSTAPAPAPAQAKTVPAPAHTKAASTKAANGRAAGPRVVKISPTKARAIAEARAEQAKAKAAHSATARANYVVTASHLNVRTGPGTRFRVVGTLARGAHVVAGTKTVNGFRQLSDGRWVGAHYLKAAR